MEIVRITKDDRGEKVDDPKWHLGTNFHDAPRTLCGGEAYGFGESSCEFKVKKLTEGKITCRRCVEIIKAIKAVKL